MAATKQVVDFTDVKDGGSFNPKRKSEGDYKAKIVKVEDHNAKSGNAQWLFTIELVSDRRATYPHYCGFDDKQAWKIRNLCIAAGLNVPKKKMSVDPNKLTGKLIGITLEDDEFEGKKKSVVSAVFPVSELTDDKPASNVEDDEDSGSDDVDDLDLEEL